MNTVQIVAGVEQTAGSAQRVSSLLKSGLVAFQEWCKRGRLHAEVCNLSDRALLDIGITRGEIE